MPTDDKLRAMMREVLSMSLCAAKFLTSLRNILGLEKTG